jgi:syntaxin-binding protein 4
LDAVKHSQTAASNRAQLAEAARNSARALEKDYDEIISLLEAEVAHLRHQLLATPDVKDRELLNTRRRVVAVGCQLNKAVELKLTFETATQELLSFARRVNDRLLAAQNEPTGPDKRLNIREDGTLRHRPSDGILPPSAGWAVGDMCRAPWHDGDQQLHEGVIHSISTNELDRHLDTCVVCFTNFENTPAYQEVALWELQPLDDSAFVVSAARGDERNADATGHLPRSRLGSKRSAAGYLTPLEVEISKAAQSILSRMETLLDGDVLPFGWEEAFTSEGVKYYIDHTTQTTSWKHPITKLESHVQPLIARSQGRPRFAEDMKC